MDTNKRRILVVEDDKIDRMAFEKFTRTESFPYEYVITGSIEDTKKVLESERFDAVVLDYFLGDGTAFELFNELKATPIIIVTDAGSEEIAAKVIKAGAYGYLNKDPEENYLKMLSLTIEVAIKRKRIENELQWYREYLEELVNEHTAELTKANERLQQEIIERKRVEQELRLLAAMVEQSTDSIIRTDTEFRINYINEATKELFGWSLDELRGKTPDIFNADPRTAEIQTDIYTTVSSGKSYSSEALNMKKNGNTFYCQFKVSPLFDENGKIYGYMGSQRDITKRKQAEVGLQQLEQAVEIMQSGVTITDLDGKIIYTNLAEAKMHGYQVEELLGKDVGILAPPELRKPESLEQIKTWKGLARESVNIRRDGSRFPVWLMSEIVKNAKGEPYAIVTSCEDITERKRAEEALQESEEKYRRVVENSNEAIIVVQDEILKFFNSKMLDITGYSQTELISKSFVEFIHPDDRGMVIERHSRRLQGEQVPDVYPFRIISAGGDVRWVEIRAVLIDWEGKLATLTFLSDITERKQAEEALREERDRAQTYLDIAGVMMIAINARREVTLINKKGCEILGYEYEEIIGKDWFDNFLPERMRNAVKDVFHQVLTEEIESVEHYENPVLTSSGEEKMISWHNTVLRDEADNIIGTLSSGEDITERKQAENIIHTQHDLSMTLSAAIGLDEGLHLCVEAALQISGMDCGGIYLFDETFEALDLVFHQGLTPDFIRNVSHYNADSAHAQLVMAGKSVYTQHQKLDESLNEVKHHEQLHAIAVIPLHHEDRVIGCLNVASHTLEEVPAFSRAALETIASQIGGVIARLQAEESLRKSEERFRTVSELTSDFAYSFHVKPDGTLVTEWMAGSFTHITGFTIEEMGQRGWTGIIYPDDRSGALKGLQDVLSGQSSTDELRVITKNGEVRWLHVYNRPVWDAAQDRVVRIIGAAQDINEEKHAQEERIILEKQLQQAQKMEAIGTLAGGIAHDFNNILGGIIGYTELIQDHIPENSRAQYYLSQTLKACNRAKDLIIQILTFSRQNMSEKQPLQLNSIIKEALKLLRATLPASIDIRYHAESDSSTILADPTQIHQVLMNLCTNAAHAMREKGGILEVDVREVDLNGDNEDQYPELEPGSYVKLSVNDTGHGMDHEILQRIFEPYFTTKATDEGTGLGLSVTLGIVRDHGGVIKAQSASGKGAAFTVVLPMIEPKIVAEKEYTPSPHGNERILFVDDEEFLVDIGQTMLKQLGYDVVTAMNSQKALELFRSQPDKFDLVITDQAMPNMTGAELAAKILQIRPDIPTILCTGFSEAITKEQARSLGIREFVLKPISEKELAHAIRKVLDET